MEKNDEREEYTYENEEREELTEERILQMLDERKFKELKEELENNMYPVDLAELMEDFTQKQLVMVFRLLAKEEAAETFAEMDSDMREMLIGGLTDSELEEVMEEIVQIMEVCPIDHSDRDSVINFIARFFSILDSNKELFLAFLGPKGDMAFVEKVENLLAARILAPVPADSLNSGTDAAHAYAFVLNGCVGMIRSWLSDDNNVGGKLVLSETQDSFYEVQWLTRGELSRDLRRFGRFTATAICYPDAFERTGLEELETTEDKLFNPFEECLPEYRISGEGMCTLTVNGATMSANVGQNLTIDVRRMCAYRNDGSLMNTSVTGDYDELHLMPGENTVTITSGFELKVVPHWGWKA